MHKKNKTNTANAFRDDILGTMDATEISKLIKQKKISAEEVTRAAIERVKEVNPIINAVSSSCYDAAISYSKTVQGDLAGIPIFIKDQANVKGLPTLHGSRSLPKKVYKKNDKTTEQILSTGLVILGKSTSSELGILPCGETLLDGNTLNPRNINHSTGGSSAGSAALVSSGAIPISHAMDGGGSIRIPASCCGLVGLKPSRGRHIDSFTKIFPIDFAEQGMVTRSVRDTANYYAAAEKYYHNPKLQVIGKVENPIDRKLRIGVYTDTLTGVKSDSDVCAATIKAAKLCESLGHEIELIKNPFDAQFKIDFTTYYSFISFVCKNFGKVSFGLNYDPNLLEPFSKYFANIYPLLMTASPLSFSRLKKFPKVYESEFRNFDVLLCPTIAIDVPEIGYWDPNQDVKLTSYRLANYINSTMVQNISGAPAISLPMGTSTNGLPIGIQFASKMGSEKLLLELSMQLEAAGGFEPYLYEEQHDKVVAQ